MLRLDKDNHIIGIDGMDYTSEKLHEIESLIIMYLKVGGWRNSEKLYDALKDYNGSISSLVDQYNNNFGVYTLDGKIVKTLPEDAFWCPICCEYHSTKYTSKITTNGDHKDVCENAYYTKVKKCRVCGKEFVQLCDGLCTQCYEDNQKYRIKRYHDSPNLVFYDENGVAPSRHGHFYGVELEVDNGGESHDVSKDVIKLMQDRVYTMHDGSLNNGFEIITHPHTENALLNLNWKETFKWLIHKGYRSHDVSTCGLHLHINRSLFKNDESIAKMVYFYENFFSEVIKVSRRNISDAQRWAGTYCNYGYVSLDNALDIVSEYDMGNNHDDRYKCVNLQNTNTVEIRIMRGTLNYNSFMACLDFMITIAKNSNKVQDIDNAKEWLDGISENTKNYLIARRAFGFATEEYDDCYNMSGEEIKELEDKVCAL